MSYSETKGGEILNYRILPSLTPVADAPDLDTNRLVILSTAGAAESHDIEPAVDGSTLIHGVAIQCGEAGERVDVQVEGVAQIKLSAAVSKGDLITAGAGGLGAVAAAGDHVIGQAIEDGVTDQIIAVRLDRIVAP